MQIGKHQIFAEKQKRISVGFLEHDSSPTAPTLSTKCDGPLLLLLLTGYRTKP